MTIKSETTHQREYAWMLVNYMELFILHCHRIQNRNILLQNDDVTKAADERQAIQEKEPLEMVIDILNWKNYLLTYNMYAKPKYFGQVCVSNCNCANVLFVAFRSGQKSLTKYMGVVALCYKHYITLVTQLPQTMQN